MTWIAALKDVEMWTSFPLDGKLIFQFSDNSGLLVAIGMA